MLGIEPLAAEALYRRCDGEALEFESTSELEPLAEIIGQERATDAVRFGIGVGGDGFNVYALGPEETEKRDVVSHFLMEEAAERPVPDDLCYVHNFDEPHRPRALRLPAGMGRRLSADIERFLEELQPALSAAYESEEYQTRRETVQAEAGEAQQEEFEQLQKKAQERDLALVRTPSGFVFAPMKEGEVLPREEAEGLSEEEKERLEQHVKELQEDLQGILRGVPRRQREAREGIRRLNSEVALHTVRSLLEELRGEYGEFPGVAEHLDAIEADVAENAQRLVGGGDEQQKILAALTGGGRAPTGEADDARLRRYRVNVLVDHGESEHAPVVYEDHPTYQNLLGRIEYLPRMGALVTDFNQIRAGAFHRANHGYLILDARRVLLQPFAWEALKRAIGTGELRIESPGQEFGLISTVSLEPEPVELKTKVVLLGSRLLYYLLSQFDPEFISLFKVQADFSEDMDRSRANEALYARLVAGLIRREELRPFDRGAVSRVIERCARLAGDAAKLSLETRRVLDLIREADYWAGEAGAERVGSEHVQRAIDQWVHRSGRVRDRIQEAILRDSIFIDTDGARVGQVNGLSVLQLSDFAFGRPSRITARVRLGKGEVVDIEREVELSGPIHSKGVLILSGFLGARYATERPLSLGASLVFEQSYGGIEGDSASSAELYALLSAIAQVPLNQSVAVTGSVNQHGRVQPIGGVNEKIEGFFDICRARGLTGEQGVLIPAANVKHLMLRQDVIEAVSEGRFNVWPVETVDQGMEILTGLPMGERDERGEYPEDSINHRVETRLAELAERRQRFVRSDEGES